MKTKILDGASEQFSVFEITIWSAGVDWNRDVEDFYFHSEVLDSAPFV